MLEFQVLIWKPYPPLPDLSFLYNMFQTGKFGLRGALEVQIVKESHPLNYYIQRLFTAMLASEKCCTAAPYNLQYTRTYP